MSKLFDKILNIYYKLKKNKLVSEIIFWISSAIVIAFLIVSWVTSKKIFLIGSAFGFLGIILYFILNPEIFKESIKELKRDKIRSEGISVGLRIIIVLIIVIILMAILNGKLPKLDLTTSKVYSISNESKELVKSLKQDLTILYFVTSEKLDSKEGKIIQTILGKYKKYSDKVKLEIIDPVKRPDLALKYGINEDGTVHISYNDRNKKLSTYEFYEITQAPTETSEGKQLFIAEKIISSAIRYLISAEGKKIYFVLGHKEKYTNDYQEQGFSTISEYLDKIDRQVININLLEKGKIPEDASVVIIAAPKENYSDQEIKIIEDYINNGGKFVLMADFDSNVNIVSKILKKYDIIQQEGVVVDDQNFYYSLGNFYPVTQLSYHNITQKVQEYNKPILINTAAPLIINPDTPKSEEFSIVSIGKTFESSWNDVAKDYDFNAQPSFDAKREKKGVKHLGFVIESLKNKNKNGGNQPIGIIFCDSDIFSNKILKYGNSIGNLLLFENSINYLVEDYTLLNIPGKDLESNKVNLSAKSQKLISLTCFVFLEVLIILIVVAIRVIRKYKEKSRG